MEKKAPRKIFAERPREALKPKLKEIPRNYDVYDNISNKRIISTAEYNNFLRVLKLELRSGDLEREEFDYYARLAKKKYENYLKRQQSEDVERSEPTVSVNEDALRRVSERELEEKRIEERRLKEKELSEDPEYTRKVPFLQRMRAFMKKPSIRIFAFILLAAFLMYYLTRSTMSNVVQNPSILIVVVLIIIIILGRGGKTRTYEPNMF